MSDFLTSLFNSDNSANHGISGDADNELNEGSSSDKFGLNDSNFITSELFGLNLKMDLGNRIDQAGDALSDEVIDLNPGVLRYPGGTVTEQYADLIFEHVIDGTKNDQAWLDRQDELDIPTDRVRFEQNNGNFKAQGSSGKFKYDDNGQTIVNGPLYLDEFLDRAADNSA